MAEYLTNAFSLNMLRPDVAALASVLVEEVPPIAVPPTVVSAVGHADTARLIGDILGWEVQANRLDLQLGVGVIYVAQYRGPRLPEGATELPPGASIRFYRVVVT